MSRLSKSLWVLGSVLVWLQTGLDVYAAGPNADGGLHRDKLKYETAVSPLSISEIPNLNLEFPRKCFIFALQYGLRNDEVAYIVLSYDSKERTFADMNVYCAGHAVYGTPHLIRGRKDKSLVTFKGFDLGAGIGKINARYKVHVETKRRVVRVRVKCVLKIDGNAVSCLSLACTVGSGTRARTKPAQIIRVLGEPKLIFNIDNRSSPPKLAGRLKMGKWKLCLERQKSCRMSLLILDKKQEVTLRKTMGLQQSSEGQFRINLLRQLRVGQAYDAELKVDLGPFLGIVASQRKIAPTKR